MTTLRIVWATYPGCDTTQKVKRLLERGIPPDGDYEGGMAGRANEVPPERVGRVKEALLKIDGVQVFEEFSLPKGRNPDDYLENPDDY
jgi:hypothetical protein